VSLPAAAREAAPSLGPPASRPRLATRSIVDYSLPTLGMGFTFVLVNIYLLKYATDVLLIAPATMGLLFGASRLWDAVADPVVGFLTDRTRSSFGRRRPWILAAALPLGITFAMLFAPPTALAGRELLLWTGGALFVFYTAIAMLETAHAALGAELTDEYHERTRVFGIRRIVFGLGTLCAVGALGAFGAAADLRRVGAVVGVLGGVVAAASILWMVVRTRERPEFRDRGAESPLRAFRDVWRNRHARVLLLVFVIQQLGVTTLMTIMPYLSEYVLLTPELTFAYREAVFALEEIEQELLGRRTPERLSGVREALDRAMRADPRHWKAYYGEGDDASLRLRRQFSLSDRARYYWPAPELQDAVRRLFANLDAERMPRGLVSQYLPHGVEAADAGPPDGRALRLARLHVRRVLARYARACGVAAAGVAADARLPL
jgi:MFS family permease